MRSRVAVVIAALILTVVAAGCSAHKSATSAAGQQSNATLAKLIAAADLSPCPSSSSTPVAGGLPNITLSCLGHGPQVHLAGLTGKPTVVNIWGSWCEPCQAEEKYLSSANDQAHGKVQFLGVDTVDAADSALDFDAHVSPPVHFPSVNDPDKKLLLALHFTGPPETLYIDASGRVVHTTRGPYTSTAAVQADIARYLHVAT